MVPTPNRRLDFAFHDVSRCHRSLRMTSATKPGVVATPWHMGQPLAAMT